MTIPAGVLSILVNADIEKAVTNLRTVDRAAATTGTTSSKSVSKFGTAAKVAGAVAATGIGFAVVAVNKSVKAAEDAQVSQAQMERALKTAGISWKAHGKEIDSATSKMSRLSGLSKVGLKNSFTSLVNVTGNVSKALVGQGLAADLARAKGISLEVATKVVSKAFLGSANAFARYGLKVEKVTTATDAYKDALRTYKDTHKELGPVEEARFAQMRLSAMAQDEAATKANVLASAQKRFAGQAKIYGDTSAGAQDRFKEAVTQLEAALGKGLLPVLTKLAEKGADMAAWLEKNKGFAVALAIAFGVLATALLAAAAAQALMNLAVLANPYVAAIAAIVAIGVAIYVFRDKIMSVFTWLKEHWPEIATIISGPFALLVAPATNAFGVRDKLIGAFDTIKDAVRDAVNGAVGFVASIPTKMLGLVDAAGEAAAKFTRPIIDAFHDVKDIIAKVVTWVKDNLIGSLKDAIGWVGDVIGALNKVPLLNKIVPGKDNGGVGGGNVGPGVKLGGSGVDQFNATAAKFGNIITSGYRPGDPGYHGMNRARDYAGGNMLAFAKYMASTYGGKLTELIHTPLGFGIKNGQQVGLGFWGSAVNADHFDHVHVALAKGGIVTKPTRALIGEDGPEAVIPLSGRNAFGGGSEYHFHFDNYVGDKEELMRVVASEMNRTIARQGYVLRPQTN